ncbi:MAG: dTDP-glucose 4,6-dehydratase [Planctomycetota bacterium]|jgi:dTDP-glucose 4,6-dehydratase|nr:dTDP-glucose 4,6-dehydratase [Planctomycetota bacterium]
MAARILITGGAGFIGSNFTRRHHEPAVIIDTVGMAPMHTKTDGTSTATLVTGSITDRKLLTALFAEHDFNTVVHFAAETHVDRSIDSPMDFVEANITGTACLLEAARAAWGDRQDVRFHHVSTDEVYGSLGASGQFTEDSPYAPRNPYSASKAASDHLVRAWHETYGLPVTISNCANNYGPYQFPEKLIPLTIMRALRHESVPVYGTGAQVRDWLHVDDHCRAIALIVQRGVNGRTYHIGAGDERRNIDVVRAVCDCLEELRPSGLDGGYRGLIYLVEDRPGHDFRYAMDATRIRDELGWVPEVGFDEGLRQTVRWYVEHPEWVAATRERYDGRRLGMLGKRER